MFFLLRAACCIGVVVAALPDPGPSGGHRPVFQGSIETMCRAAPARCLDLLEAGLRTGSGEAYAMLADHLRSTPSRDTLTAGDRLPAWAGAVHTAAN